MPVPGFLRPVVALLSWPAGRFVDVRRTWDVALAPSDARAVLRGAIGTDPMHLPVMDGIAASRRADVVGRVEDDGRLEVYVVGRRRSGLGLVGVVSASGPGSRIDAGVGWIGMEKWLAPLWAIALIVLEGILAQQAIAAGDGLVAGASLLLAAILGAGWLLNLTTRARVARRRELPAILERLDRALAPHLRHPAGRGGAREP